MKINSNVSTANLSNLNQVKEQQEKSLERLATGLKINQAADDAAGFQIAQRLFTQASGLQVAVRNANDSYSLASVADSAIAGVSDATQRVQELSIQAANGTLTAADRESIQFEITQIQSQVSDIQKNTTFAGQSLFASSENRNFQVGSNAGETIGFSTNDFNAQIEQLQQVDVTTQAGAQEAITTAQNLNESFNTARTQIGAFQNRISSTINNLSNIYEQTVASSSRIADTDFAQETANKAQQDFLVQGNVAIQAQANSQASIALNLLN